VRQLVLSGEFAGLPENRHALSDLAKAMYGDSRAEAGCRSYACFAQAHDPDKYVFFEEWADDTAIEAHFATPHFAGFMDRFPKLIEGFPAITIYDVTTVTDDAPAPDDALIVLAGRFAGNPDKRDELLALAASMFEPSRSEAGCVSYNFYEEIGKPGSYLFFERWKNKAAIDAHFATPDFARFMEAFPGLVEGPLDIKLFAVTTSRAV
jgi:quinol monooxygenase YgiN